MPHKIAFLDRDGVINKYPGDRQYVLNKEGLEIFPFVKESIQRLKDAGFLVYIVSNQACVSKGLISVEQLKDITRYLLSSIEQETKLIDGVYYCVHKEEDSCPCRKPNPGLIKQIFNDLSFDTDNADSRFFFIGDSIRDVKTAKNVSMTSILVLSGRESYENRDSWEVKPDHVFGDLKEAADFIVAQIATTEIQN